MGFPLVRCTFDRLGRALDRLYEADCEQILPIDLRNVGLNTDVMLKASELGRLNATKILESLVLKGIPFRDAHHQVGQWVLEATEQGVTLSELLKSEGGEFV